ncbi:MAG: hypothetical protein UZ17_ACD001000034 [Acidobacteria bacterium OLB17]|nr:MAG: hypothetical protein UZ17_ACD001000034 [Acidobacteria bacterium OLB17]MCZ2391490.1 hypothetical protein [Acidobacteriota bacterium]
MDNEKAIETEGTEATQNWLRRFIVRKYDFLEQPLPLVSRLLIIIAAVTLLAVFFFPLWNMTFFSNQYTDGLMLDIYAYRLEGAKTPNRDDLREINSLNHYIGMRPLLESDFSEFVWLPFAVGGLMLLALRAVVLGKMSKLVDVFVLFVYFSLYSFWSFYYRLHSYGHNLDPTAAIKVEPFTPPLFGEQVVGNFTVYSYPDTASYAFFVYGILLFAAIAWAWRGNKRALAAAEA